MKKLLHRIENGYCPLPVALALLMILGYGLVVRRLGIYWDDWAYLWTKFELGAAGMERHFSFSRPLAGQIQNIVMTFTGKNPLTIQLYGLLMRTGCATLVGWLVFRIWNTDKLNAALAATFFIVYPGFTMQPIALNFGFSYLLLSLLLISFLLTLRVIRTGRYRLPLTIGALSLSAVNLFASEYFFLLELLRPLLIWFKVRHQADEEKAVIKRTTQYSAPYLLLFMAGVLYRAFFNRTQTLHYDFSLLSQLKQAPLQTTVDYFAAIARDLFAVTVQAWGKALQLPSQSQLGSQTFAVYLAVIGLALGITTALFFIYSSRRKEKPSPDSVQMMLTGLIAMLLGGQPFWLTQSWLSFVFPNSRYTLPFLLGMALFMTGLFRFFMRTRTLTRLILLGCAALVAFGTGDQFVTANAYRRDWTTTRDFFYQLKWRIPALEANTVLITNVMPIRFSSDNSLTAPLNWIYAPEYSGGNMPYMLYTNTKREETLSRFEVGKRIVQEYLSARFEGNTQDAISVYYKAPGCVHVLDPEVDGFNQTIPIIDREAALLTNKARILPQSGDLTGLDNTLFGAEPGKNWCWYYEHADLARQQRDWKTVAHLGDEAFALSDHPNDPMERIPFIEGYAHQSEWEKALRLTHEMLEVTPMMNNPLCALWQRIEREIAPGAANKTAVAEASALLDCTFLPNKTE